MCEHDRHNSDFYIRPCFANATAALSEIEKGRAIGGGLCLREAFHRRLDLLGQFLLCHAGKVLFVWMLMVATFSVGLKSSQFTYRLEGLWLPDAGRIGDELSYTMTYLGETDSWNNLMVIQMPADTDTINQQQRHQKSIYGSGQRRGEHTAGHFKYMDADEDDPTNDNILTRDALIAHLNIILKASQVSVQLFDVDWKLKDLCQSASMPTSDSIHYINQIFENIFPCNIITPLDCFWEGSKLLGPEYPVNIPMVGNRVKWTNLNPQELLAKVKDSYRVNFEFRILEDYLNKSGISTAYQHKPCLDPNDVECPETAPNYRNKEIPDIAALMTGGCYGYAKNFMHWPEQLILGGVAKNKTKHVRRAKAIQTVIQLMGNKDMYEFWQDTFKVHHIGWNPNKAAQILDAWQKRFAQEVKRLQAAYSYKTFPFSMSTLNESLRTHTNLNVIKMAIVVSLLMVYCMFMGQYIAVFGVVMLILNTIAGLGFCALLGVPLNILTIQVVPYLCLGLSLRDIWVLLHSYKLTKDTRQSLKQCTPSITAHNLYLAATFVACILLPVPALKAAAMQCAVLILSNTLAVLIVFPGILSIDQRRKQAFNNRVKNYLNRQGTLNHAATKTLPFPKSVSECSCDGDDKLIAEKIRKKPAEFLLNKITKILCLVCLGFGIFIGIYHAYQLKFSLEMPEFLPRNCSDYKYLKVHEKYFGFYGFSTVTMDVNYPSSQYLVKEYHNTIANSRNVLSGESNSWLEIFQNYLIELQYEFEDNLDNGRLNSEKWHKNATKNAILAYKLLANTGNVNHPIEKSEILTKKLVTNGLIEEEPYYNYFSAWSSNDPIFTFLKNTFRPHPKEFTDSEEYDLKIPKTKPLKYIETQFYVEKMHNTDEIIELIQEVRRTSDAFYEKGLKNYPKGLIFAFYDQFIDIYQHFAAVFGGNILSCFVCAFILLNFNTSLFVIAFKMILIIFLAVGYNVFNIDMNIVFVMTTSVAITILARNLILLIEGFVTSIGNRERRARLTIELNLWPLFQGNLSFLISIAVFYTSDFDFIRKYFFYTFVITIIVDSLSTFILFPVFLSCFGPKPMLIPLEHADRINTPSPIPSPVITRKHHPHHHRSRRHNSHSISNNGDACVPGIAKPTTREPSLTTITEESGCSITVQPEVVVQTTTYSNQNDTANNSTNAQHVTTKVTATANIKVEVHSRPNSRREDRNGDNRSESRNENRD